MPMVLLQPIIFIVTDRPNSLPGHRGDRDGPGCLGPVSLGGSGAAPEAARSKTHFRASNRAGNRFRPNSLPCHNRHRAGPGCLGPVSLGGSGAAPEAARFRTVTPRRFLGSVRVHAGCA